MTTPSDINRIRENTRAVYQRQAQTFDAQRARDGRETEWLEAFIQTLPNGGRILDLGCGTGDPVAGWLIERGFKITGVDYSEPMLAIAKARFPDETWLHLDMRALDLPEKFDGILSWHGSFHLGTDEQRALIPKLCGMLLPGGTLMLTIGPSEGEVTGTIGSETVYHASLDPREYRELLETEGFTHIALSNNDANTNGPYVLLARK